ncbi:hypothetical protein Micbo1qcDRAFT_163282 [Microdochium bolleyi]|uniref:Uncharacterized protein n=1 Tax=Microdochium bolleyi TaxID=196109 RepID=A0A136J2Y4_9PEZI|nr:hypothetical protein Micbo1qcDRAFT_163282 [Microdochium bolleyi]
MAPEVPILTVLDAAAWSRWLASSGRTSSGVWLTLAKKNVSKPTSLTYTEALDEALCQGWIDGQRRGGDDRTFSQRFTPRTAKSAWSQRNVAHVARLESQGRIQEQGRLAIEAARADGRWDAAYAGSSTAELPSDFLDAVAAVPAAKRALEWMSKQERFAIYLRLAALKTAAGREKRIAAYVDMLAGGQGENVESEDSRPGNESQNKTASSGKVVRSRKQKPDTARAELSVTPAKKRKASVDIPMNSSSSRRSARLSRAAQQAGQ